MKDTNFPKFRRMDTDGRMAKDTKEIFLVRGSGNSRNSNLLFSGNLGSILLISGSFHNVQSYVTDLNHSSVFL